MRDDPQAAPPLSNQPTRQGSGWNARALLGYAMILIPGNMLIYFYPSWPMVLGIFLAVGIFQATMITKSTLIAIAGGFPGVTRHKFSAMTLKRAHQLLLSPLAADIDCVWDGFGNWSSGKDRYKIRMVRSGYTWYVQRTPNGVTQVSTRLPLNETDRWGNPAESIWTTWHTITVAEPTMTPPITFDPAAIKHGLGGPRPVYTPTREATKAKVDELVVVRTSDLKKGNIPMGGKALVMRGDPFSGGRDKGGKKRR